MKAKTVREVYCIYSRTWVPLGRSRTRCPNCHAELKRPHEIRVRSTKKEAA